SRPPPRRRAHRKPRLGHRRVGARLLRRAAQRRADADRGHPRRQGVPARGAPGPPPRRLDREGGMTEAAVGLVAPEPRPEVAPASMSARDLLSEAVAGIFSRPGRTVLTVLGTVLGIGALVATLGVAKTAGNQIVGRFDELAATSVVVTNEQGFFGGGG